MLVKGDMDLSVWMLTSENCRQDSIIIQADYLIKLSQRSQLHMHKFRQTSGPQYFGSAQKKSLFETSDTYPGPGSHSPKQPSKQAAPEWNIGLSTYRHSFLDPNRATIPSPQHYQVSYHEVEKLSKKMSIPLSSPTDKTNSVNLKNCYDATLNLTKTTLPLFSFGYSREPDYSTFAPGPGAYDLPKSKINFNKTQSGFSIGQRLTPYGDEVKVPSPNKYNPNSTIQSPKYSFGKAARSQLTLNDTPGRFYDLEPKKTTMRLGRGHSTEYKREITFLVANQGPAPNAYHIGTRNKISGGTFEASKRTSIENSAVCQFPSADKYLIHKDFDLKRGKSFIKDDRHLNVTPDGIPGPGSYVLMSTLSRVGAALPKKPNKNQGEEEVRLAFPGPAAYHPIDTITRRKGGSTIVLRSNRQDFSKSLTKKVGPGTYEIAGCFDREMGKIGRSTRRPLDLPNSNPGVGMYDINIEIGHQQKRSTLSEATSEKTNKQKFPKPLRKGQESARKSEIDSSMYQGHNPEMSERVPLRQQANNI